MSSILKSFERARSKVLCDFLEECEAAFNWYVSAKYPDLDITEVGASLESDPDGPRVVVLFYFSFPKTTTPEQFFALTQSLNVLRQYCWEELEDEVHGEIWLEDYPSLADLLVGYEEELARRSADAFRNG